MKDITLIYPHQLFEQHPALKKGRHVALIEDSLFFGDKKYISHFHCHKLVFHRSTMKMYADRLKSKGYTIHYIAYRKTSSSAIVIQELIQKGYHEFHCADVTDTRLSEMIKKAALKNGASVRNYESPMFLTPAPYVREHFSGKSKFLMASFYMEQRKRLGILVRNNKPVGGKWSYDAENRKRIPSDLKIPDEPHVKKTKHVSEAVRYVEKTFPACYGEPDTFWYPASHEKAKQWLSRFLSERLALFGDYEDAIHSGNHVLFHSVLTPMLNTGLLTPEYVIEKTLSFADENRIPLNSLEGFIRQIIGWREFIRAMYEIMGEKQRTSNFWKHTGDLPDAFYSGNTGIDPVDTIIKRVTDRSYCHHIERLMVLGNFMLLCGIKPDAVYRWFMELFIDAYDWVMVPNVYGMSQFADGGIFATKPYISGANYLLKMSDFKKGTWCDIWTSLFWNFIATHSAFFAKQPRLSIMVKQLERQGVKSIKNHRKRAEEYLSRLYGNGSNI